MDAAHLLHYWLETTTPAEPILLAQAAKSDQRTGASPSATPSARVDITFQGIISGPGSKQLVSATTVPARLGMRFGIAYAVKVPSSGQLRVRSVWRFPGDGLPDPAEKKPVPESTIESPCLAGHECNTYFTFDHPWEMRTGTWTVLLYSGGQELARRTFEVVPP